MENREYKKLVNDSGEFFKNYCRSSYNDDWKFKMDWSMGFKIKDSKYWKIWMERLKVYVLGLGLGVGVFDSIYVTEFNKSGNLHLHSVIYVDSSNLRIIKDSIWNYCRNKGSINVELYDNELGFDYYMSKYLYQKVDNNFGILGLNI